MDWTKEFAMADIFAFSVYLLALSIPFSIFIGQVAAAMVLSSGALTFALSGRGVRLDSRWVVITALYLILTVLSAILSGHFADSIHRLGKIWVILCFFPLAGLGFYYSPRRVIDFLILGTTIASILALYRYFMGMVGRAAPYSGGYTTLALFIAAVIPFTIYRIALSKSLSRWLLILSAVVCLASLLFTKTRAGWLAAIAGIVIVGLAINGKKTIIGLALALLLLAAVPGTREMAIARFTDTSRGGVTSGRLMLYRSALEPLAHLPILGYGPGSFERLISPVVLERIGDTGIRSWHSTPLEILLESGPLALLVFMIMAFMPAKEALRRFGMNPEGRLKTAAWIGSIAALYLAGLTTNLVRDFMLLSLMVIFWTMPVADRVRSNMS